MADPLEIRTVADFYKVPKERRSLCLSEFLIWMTVCEVTDAMGLSKSVRDVFKWIDDDKGEMHVNIKPAPPKERA